MNEVECPNCRDMVSGLYSGDHNVSHCGCYYEGRGNFTLETDPFWLTWEYNKNGRLALIGEGEIDHILS